MAITQSTIVNASSHDLAPTYSPRTPSRSPTRAPREDRNLVLKQVIGSTILDNNGLDYSESTRCFAFAAGATAVLAHIDEHRKLTHRIFRSKPNQQISCPSASFYDSPLMGTPQMRRRTARESGFGVVAPSSDSVDSPLNKPGGLRERMKAATCVALSKDGRFLAIGETGYKPRVLLFSTAKTAPTDTPVTVLSEHTFGVRCMAFSPNSQYLATLGNMNDGFLYIWSISRSGSATCILTNKCTSNIRHISWLGSSLITCGTRHVKLWRIEPETKKSPSKRFSDANMSLVSSPSKALVGRNVLLGHLLDKTFTAIAQICEGKAVVCSDEGDVCILDDNESPRFYKVTNVDFKINAVTLFHKSIVVTGDHGKTMVLGLDRLLLSGDDQLVNHFQSMPTGNHSEVVAIASIGDNIVISTSDRNIQIIKASTTPGEPPTSYVAHQSPAHAGAVQGVRPLKIPNKLNASFYTWSSEGTVIFWSSEGILKARIDIQVDQIDNEEALFNELKVVRSHPNLDFLVTGDKLGILRIIDMTTKETTFITKAHASEITDIAIEVQESQTIIASAGRDRMVQLFSQTEKGCEIIQTLDDHAGAVTGILFSTKGQKLVSCSSDRSLIIREAVTRTVHGAPLTVYVATRTITLKATPLSIDMRQDGTLLFVSTADRNMHTYDLDSGGVPTSFKTADVEGGDAVIMSCIVHSQRTNQSVMLAGVSSTDKSIRIYDGMGRLLSREYGHTEGVTGISILEDDHAESKALVTVATDGTIFIWSLVSDADQMLAMLESLDLDPVSAKTSQLLAAPPLRRVISFSELNHIQEGGEEDSISPLCSPGNNRQGLRGSRSRLSMVTAPGFEPAAQASRRISIGLDNSTPRSIPLSSRSSNVRSNSPCTPKDHSKTLKAPRRSLRSQTRRVSSTNDLSAAYKRQSQNSLPDIAMNTEQICQALQIYRQALSSEALHFEDISSESVQNLQRQLSLTVQALNERTDSLMNGSQSPMAQLLDQYSERLVGLLDERIESCVARNAKARSTSSSVKT